MTSPRALPRNLVGHDFARVRPTLPRPRAGLLGWLLVATITCALALAALRIDILRLRYALGESIETEQTLAQQQRQHQVLLETLRDPSRLAEFARERGFERPTRVLELRGDAVGATTP